MGPDRRNNEDWNMNLQFILVFLVSKFDLIVIDIYLSLWLTRRKVVYVSCSDRLQQQIKRVIALANPLVSRWDPNCAHAVQPSKPFVVSGSILTYTFFIYMTEKDR